MKVVDSDSGQPGTERGTAVEVVAWWQGEGVMPTGSLWLEYGLRPTNRSAA